MSEMICKLLIFLSFFFNFSFFSLILHRSPSRGGFGRFWTPSLLLDWPIFALNIRIKRVKVSRTQIFIELYTYIYFVGTFLLFFIKKFISLSFWFFFFFFFDKVSNFRNRILTSQNLKFVKTNFQWNCMSILHENFGQGFFRHEFFSEVFEKILCISIQRRELWSVRHYSVFVKHVAIKIFRTWDFCFFCRRFPCKLICLIQCGFFGGVFSLPAN